MRVAADVLTDPKPGDVVLFYTDMAAVVCSPHSDSPLTVNIVTARSDKPFPIVWTPKEVLYVAQS